MPILANHPTRDFWKDLIHVGVYRHPRRRFTLNVTPARLHRWARTARRMLAAGIRIPINADHSPSARDTLGHIVAMTVRGNRLYALHRFIGDDAIRMAARNDVSVGIEPQFTDASGRRWRDAIVHVALTPTPLVSRQQPFIEARAAPKNPSPSPTIALSRTLLFHHPSPSRNPMPDLMLPCSADTLAALHNLVPGLADVANEQKLAFIADYLRLPDDEPQPVNASLDPHVAGALIEAVQAKADLAVARGALTPAVRDRLLAKLTKDATGRVNTIALSRNGDDEPALALSVFDILSENRPVPLGTQGVTLPRATPGDGGDSQRSAAMDRMIAIASGR